MGIFLILFLSIIAVDNVNILSTKIPTVKEKSQNQVNSVDLKKPIITNVKTEPKKTESIKEVVNSKSLIKEPVKETVNSEPLIKEPVKETVNSEPLIKEPVKETVNSEPLIKEPVKEVLEQTSKAQEPIKKGIKSKTIKEIENTNESGTSWLILALYILGPILIIVLGKNLYTKIKNNSLTAKRNDYMRQEFKEKIEPETTEQQPAQEEIEPETTEQQPAQEEIEPETTEQQPAQEEIEPETTEQQTVEKDENNNK
jgi:hypothetical protein